MEAAADELNGIQRGFLDGKISPQHRNGGTAADNHSTKSLINGNSTGDGKREPQSAALMKIKTYLLALRPWSLSASLVPTILGSAIAYRTPGDFNLLTFVLTIFTVITVHGAGNVVNTYFDFVKGIDNRKSDDRTLVDHILSKDEVRVFNLLDGSRVCTSVEHNTIHVTDLLEYLLFTRIVLSTIISLCYRRMKHSHRSWPMGRDCSIEVHIICKIAQFYTTF